MYIQNSIVLLMLFIVNIFDNPMWAKKELYYSYKQLLGSHATSIESRRHKVNPGLLVSPGHARGICLSSVGHSQTTTKQSIRFLVYLKIGHVL